MSQPTWFTTFAAAVRDERFTHAERTAFLAVLQRADHKTGEVHGALARILAASPFRHRQRLGELLVKAHALGYMETERQGARRAATRWVIFK